jgi:hypothetical protein
MSTPQTKRAMMRYLSVTKQSFVVGALSLLLASCGDNKNASLTSPTAVPATPAAPSNYTLFGTISAVAVAPGTPVEGVLVEETNSHHSAITDAKGIFNIPGVSGPLSISVSKSGYFTENFPTFPAGANNMQLRIVPIPATYTLSGVVSELTAAGQTPVEGVLIDGNRCRPGSCELQHSMTDSKGLYSISVYVGQNSIWVTKEGYDVEGRPAMPSCENCNAIVTLNVDTRFDIQLIRR